MNHKLVFIQYKWRNKYLSVLHIYLTCNNPIYKTSYTSNTYRTCWKYGHYITKHHNDSNIWSHPSNLVIVYDIERLIIIVFKWFFIYIYIYKAMCVMSTSLSQCIEMAFIYISYVQITNVHNIFKRSNKCPSHKT